ncbi:MAG TPA: glycosyltransferase family 9 protein [Armatimonadota bacterium]|nr:glycosyltransferase family 9 protein [Armatimonadota bacterium]
MPHETTATIPDRDAAPRILIIRLGAIGDVIMTSAVPQAIKEAYPNARISWLVEPLSVPIVRMNPYVDDIIVFDCKKDWVTLLRAGKLVALTRAVRAFRQLLREGAFDIAIDFQELFKSAFLAWLSGAPRRIGPAPSREGNRFFMTELAARPAHPTWLSQANLALLAPLGAPQRPRRPVLVVPDAERAAARDFLASRGLVGAPYAAFCLSSSRPQKDWVFARWSELADTLWEQEGLRTVLIGGPERRVDALGIVESCASQPVSAVGYTNIMQSTALVQDAALVVGLDTGLTYAGLAVDTPTIALYGSTDPSWLAEEPCATVCFHPLPCSPCGRRPTCRQYDCMQAISVAEVADTVRRLLKQRLTASGATKRSRAATL